MTGKTLHLHGALRRFGPKLDFRLETPQVTPRAKPRATPQAIVGAAASQLPGLAAILRRGRFELTAGPARRPIGGAMIDLAFAEADLHLSPVRGGAARGEGKMLLGLTLLGLSFVPGVQAGITSGLSGFGEGLAGAAGAEFGGMLGSRLLGGTGALLLLSGASEALSPQARHQAGQASTGMSPGEPTGEGAAIPLVYGTVRLAAPPVVSAGLSVEVMHP